MKSNNKRTGKQGKRDVLLGACILLLAGILFLGMTWLRSPGAAVTISRNGVSYGTYPLSQDREIPIDDVGVLCIKDGKAFMQWASCKNQICVHHLPVSKGGECIVCLPNGITVKVLAEDAVDFISS